ncbi:MAG: hypothetical protein D6737_04610 [Chloroflexi bacterium]|nr:MAG: hypothetical protein D6737_04610 [Chloroflexota bacterium]
MIEAHIAINPQQVIGEIDDHLYGANLENLGQTIYGGNWAEMLRDRKFAGHDAMYVTLSEGLTKQNPSYGVVLPWQAVNPHHDNVLFVHDNTTYHTGTQSQRITIRHEDGQPHGVEQTGLYLEAGFSYQVRIVLKGEGQPVTVKLGDQTWVIEAADVWTSYRNMLTPTQTEALGAFSVTIERGNLWIGCASVMPGDNLSGHRPDVVAAIREWPPTFLRWPGGNFVSAYHWQDGIGDIDKRPSYLDPAWNLIESNDMGTDEFIDLCRLVGSRPVLTANMGNGTPEEAAAWVEYCNGDASTTYGAMRIENGYIEPHNVKVWFVGNEQFGNWQVGHVDAETYARRYLEFARAMRAVDPDLLLIAVGVPTELYGHWNELVLDIAGDEIDWLSLHYYSVRTEKWETPPPPEAMYIPKVVAAHEVAEMLDDTMAVVAQHSDPPTPIAFDEWNTYIRAKPPNFIEDYDIGDALYAGSLMNACIQRCDRIKLTAIYNLINVMGNYMVTPLFTWRKVAQSRGDYWVGQVQDDATPPMVWKAPTTLVMELLTQQRGNHAIACTVESPTFSSEAIGSLPAYSAVPTVDAAATYDADNGIVYLSVVNRSADETARLSLGGITSGGDVMLYIVAGDSPFALNTADTPQRVMIEEQSIALTDGNFDVPPHSFTMAVIKLR